jgi:hypothetical protein
MEREQKYPRPNYTEDLRTLPASHYSGIIRAEFFEDSLLKRTGILPLKLCGNVPESTTLGTFEKYHEC